MFKEYITASFFKWVSKNKISIECTPVIYRADHVLTLQVDNALIASCKHIDAPCQTLGTTFCVDRLTCKHGPPEDLSQTDLLSGSSHAVESGIHSIVNTSAKLALSTSHTSTHSDIGSLS